MDFREKTSNEKRLIDADRAMEIVRNQGIAHPNAYHLTNYATLILREAPTVDAVEVVHGRWEEMHYEGGILDGTNFDRCSVCGYERVFDDPALKTVFKYCPNCGSKMDGGAD